MYSRRELGDRVPRVPRNYSGNAFREAVPPAPSEAIEVVEEAEELNEGESLNAVEKSPVAVPAAKGHSLFGGLFGQSGIGSEELLLLGLILLLSQSNEKDDLLLWLILLLFIR